MKHNHYSIFDIIAMSPENAGEVLDYEIKKRKPDLELIRNILEFSPVNVNWKDNQGWSLLKRACWVGHVDIVKLLLDQPDINMQAKDQVGFTAFDAASYKDYYHILDLIAKPLSSNP